MKYIVFPFWVLICGIWVLLDIILFLIINILIILWNFNTKRVIDWRWHTEEESYLHHPGYDENPYETLIRRITFGDYKHHA